MEEQKQVVVAEKTLADNVLNKVNEFQKNKSIALPDNYSPENALKSAWLILLETKDRDGKFALSVCTKESIANAMLEMVIQGLNPVKKQCYFIVYGSKLVLQRSYHGNVALAKRLGGVKSVVSNAIYNDDVFEYEVDMETGSKKITKHIQKLENIDSDKVKGAYAIVTMENGSKFIEVMNMHQIRKSWEQGATKGKSPAHNNFADEMAKKTVISRACKLFISTSDDADVYEEIDPMTIQVTAVEEEIAQNANTKTIGFEPVQEIKEQPTTEATQETKAPF